MCNDDRILNVGSFVQWKNIHEQNLHKMIDTVYKLLYMSSICYNSFAHTRWQQLYCVGEFTLTLYQLSHFIHLNKTDFILFHTVEIWTYFIFVSLQIYFWELIGMNISGVLSCAAKQLIIHWTCYRNICNHCHILRCSLSRNLLATNGILRLCIYFVILYTVMYGNAGKRKRTMNFNTAFLYMVMRCLNGA